ncbi:MAG: hypothetical protein U0324_00645 [Polyangiales bacterium]
MPWLVFSALVLVTSVASYAARERSHRRRWQLVNLPPVTAGEGAYRESSVAPGHLAEAPGPLRFMVLSCIAYGRLVTFALLATALYLADAGTDAIAVPTLHAMLGYFAAGGAVGPVAAMLLAASVMRAGNDLLARDPRRVFVRTRATALASLALHGFVAVNATTGAWLVGLGGRDASVSLHTTRLVATAGAVHALLLLAMVHTYRTQLTARSPQAAAVA